MRLRHVLAPALVAYASAALAEPLVLEGEVPDDGSGFLLLPFDVPAGTAEIRVEHEDLSDANILDWGLDDPSGFRGWGGGNDEPAIVGEQAASRSYLRGPIRAGRWHVVIGKAKIADPPARYRVSIDLKASATLEPQPERRPYSPAAPLRREARWYAGDFHVHSRESGDARPPLDEIATFARGRGLDFVELSDHNTTSQLDFIADAQSRHAELLLIPGVEFTTYSGHANGIGATAWVNHRLGAGATIDAAARAFAAQGAIFSINHPVLDLGDVCIGCAWDHTLDPALVGAVEIATGGWNESGFLFYERAIAFWDGLCDGGRRIAAIGGSDDHRAGVDIGAFGSPIGSPTTMVFATELSAAGILDAVRRGRTVVKLQGPDDPMIDLRAGDAMVGDLVEAERVTLTALVTGGTGGQVRFIHNGEPQDPVDVTSDPFTASVEAVAPATTVPDRWRVEVLKDGHAATVTSHLWIAPPQGCGCAGQGGAAVALVFALAALGLRRRSASARELTSSEAAAR